ncbi:energy-coupling factor ABC transporter ATP-binding protein [Candidatus Bathyarchaeota archaeon]|nr:energy-coupling factor ABC transporter ATP-binding protein [Candidatus Bathyarchaeota archaeon]
MISVESLQFVYPNGNEALRGVDLSIQDGEFLAVMGENGAGKTTLVKTFNGLLRPTQGRILVDGVDTKKSSVAALARDVGLVFQNPDHQLFCETVRDEVAYSLRNFGYPTDVVERRVTSILEALDLTPHADSSPFMLSGGERKRVALASVLVWNPRHIVLDEPTIGQDYQQKDRLRNLIVQLNAQGKTVIMVTHDVEFVAECKPRVVLLSRGRIIADGKAGRILTDRVLVENASLLQPQISLLLSSINDLPSDIIDVYSARTMISNKIGRLGNVNAGL